MSNVTIMLLSFAYKDNAFIRAIRKKVDLFFFDNLVFANVEREKRCPLFSLYFLFNYILFFPFLFFYLHNSALQMYNRAMQLHHG